MEQRYSNKGVRLTEDDLNEPKPKQPVLAIINDTLALEALRDNVIVKEDRFRTGYECPECDGEGHTTEPCKVCKGSKVEDVTNVCRICDGEGVVTDLFRPIEESMVSGERKTKTCSHCRGTKIDPDFERRKIEPGLYQCKRCLVKDISGIVVSSGHEVCSKCKGLGSAVLLPQESVRRPNSGIVISTGDLCKRLKPGDRVLYSNHTGMAIEFKRNVVFRWMREDELPIQMHGVGKIHEHLL